MDSVRPTLIYDGDCGFCLSSLQWIKQRVGERLQYLSSGEVGEAFSHIPKELFSKTVVLAYPNGTYVTKAKAIFEALALAKKRSLLSWAHHSLPGFGTMSDWAYDKVATHRRFFSRFF